MEKEFVLSTGKKVIFRIKTGATHMVENRLTATCLPRGTDKDEFGMNAGDMIAMSDIRTVISIASIDNEKINIPRNLSDVYEVMSKFVYDDDCDEWSELKVASTPNKDEIETESKNLQSNIGSKAESKLLTKAVQE